VSSNGQVPSEFAAGVIESMARETEHTGGPWHDASQAAVLAAAHSFEREAGHLLERTGMSRRNAGRLAWLDASGHGVGFWVEDYAHLASRKQAERLGVRLSALADKHLGGFVPYVGADGALYVMGLESPREPGPIIGRRGRKRA